MNDAKQQPQNGDQPRQQQTFNLDDIGERRAALAMQARKIGEIKNKFDQMPDEIRNDPRTECMAELLGGLMLLLVCEVKRIPPTAGKRVIVPASGGQPS